MFDKIISLFVAAPAEQPEPDRKLSTGILTEADGTRHEVVQWIMPDGKTGAVTYEALAACGGAMVLEEMGNGRVKLTAKTEQPK